MRRRYIYFNKRVGKHQVSFRRAGQSIHVGFFDELIDAVVARNEVLEKLRHPPLPPVVGKTKNKPKTKEDFDEEDLKLLELSQSIKR